MWKKNLTIVTQTNCVTGTGRCFIKMLKISCEEQTIFSKIGGSRTATVLNFYGLVKAAQEGKSCHIAFIVVLVSGTTIGQHIKSTSTTSQISKKTSVLESLFNKVADLKPCNFIGLYPTTLTNELFHRYFVYILIKGEKQKTS